MTNTNNPNYKKVKLSIRSYNFAETLGSKEAKLIINVALNEYCLHIEKN